MASGRRIRSLLRWVVLGRKGGFRAGLRRRFGVCTSVDAEADGGASTDVETTPAAPVEPQDLEGWSAVLAAEDLADGEVIEAMVGERALAIARVGDEVFALDNVCPHAGGPLGDGVLNGCELTCPWHGWTFDVSSGACTMDPSLTAETVEAKLHGGHIYVRG
jgi:nitrite reductase/ring-hydroxylating ferredoxin subunit